MSNRADSLTVVNLKLAVGGWVIVCRGNAQRLAEQGGIELQVRELLGERRWHELTSLYDMDKPWLEFRAKIITK